MSMQRGTRSAKHFFSALLMAGTALASGGAAYAQDADVSSGLNYVIRHDRWTEADERGYGEFIAGIGNSNCRTVDSCLRGPGNPFRASDPSSLRFRSDCADLPYYLRAYYAWKRGLPFAYEAAVSPVGRSRDIRYSPRGNRVSVRRDVTTGSMTGPELLNAMRNTISSAMYRIHPNMDSPYPPDHYSPALQPKSVRLGTIIYDPNGHLAIVYKIEANGRILYIDAHPDNSLTRGTYDKRFVRSRPGMGAGFKNWRPVTLRNYTKGANGALLGGSVVAAENEDIADFSTEQFFGTGRPVGDADWQSASFTLDGENLDYYDYVRAQLSGGSLRFDPVNEVRAMVRSNCADLHYRADAVELSLAAGLQRRAHPSRLPYNIYGTDGDWEIYSTPSRDARLKTAFKELRDDVERFVRLYEQRDPKLVYAGRNLVADLSAAYEQEASACAISYTKSDGVKASFTYEDARARLFRMSFDPYNCVELRWGARESELAACRDDSNKRAWYEAEQNLRNQTDRTYESRMDHDLAGLRAPGGEGKGVADAPDTDVRLYLAGLSGARVPAPAGGGALPPARPR